MFDAIPMAPIGTECLSHLKPLRRKTWDFHASDGWYVAPALKHHRVWQVVSKETGAVRYTDTIKFKHHTLTTPSVSAEDRIVNRQQCTYKIQSRAKTTHHQMNWRPLRH